MAMLEYSYTLAPYSRRSCSVGDLVRSQDGHFPGDDPRYAYGPRFDDDYMSCYPMKKCKSSTSIVQAAECAFDGERRYAPDNVAGFFDTDPDGGPKSDVLGRFHPSVASRLQHASSGSSYLSGLSSSPVPQRGASSMDASTSGRATSFATLHAPSEDASGVAADLIGAFSILTADQWAVLHSAITGCTPHDTSGAAAPPSAATPTAAAAGRRTLRAPAAATTYSQRAPSGAPAAAAARAAFSSRPASGRGTFWTESAAAAALAAAAHSSHSETGEGDYDMGAGPHAGAGLGPNRVSGGGGSGSSEASLLAGVHSTSDGSAVYDSTDDNALAGQHAGGGWGRHGDQRLTQPRSNPISRAKALISLPSPTGASSGRVSFSGVGGAAGFGGGGGVGSLYYSEQGQQYPQLGRQLQHQQQAHCPQQRLQQRQHQEHDTHYHHHQQLQYPQQQHPQPQAPEPYPGSHRQPHPSSPSILGSAQPPGSPATAGCPSAGVSASLPNSPSSHTFQLQAAQLPNGGSSHTTAVPVRPRNGRGLHAFYSRKPDVQAAGYSRSQPVHRWQDEEPQQQQRQQQQDQQQQQRVGLSGGGGSGGYHHAGGGGVSQPLPVLQVTPRQLQKPYESHSQQHQYVQQQQQQQPAYPQPYNLSRSAALAHHNLSAAASYTTYGYRRACSSLAALEQSSNLHSNGSQGPSCLGGGGHPRSAGCFHTLSHNTDDTGDGSSSDDDTEEATRRITAAFRAPSSLTRNSGWGLLGADSPPNTPTSEAARRDPWVSQNSGTLSGGIGDGDGGDGRDAGDGDEAGSEPLTRKRSSYHLTNTHAAVELFLRLNHARQTIDFVKRQTQLFGRLDKAEMSVWEALHALNELREYEAVLMGEPGEPQDVSELSLLDHAFQTAELCRLHHPDLDWMHLVGLVHGLGKLLAHSRFGCQPQWAICGESFPLGCRFSPHILGAQYFTANPDRRRRLYNTATGMYGPGCGLLHVAMSWSAPEYLHLVLRLNQAPLPQDAVWVLRHSKFLTLTRPHGCYLPLCSPEDLARLPLLRSFQHLAAYRRVELPEGFALRGEQLTAYYDGLIAKYIGSGRLRW